MPKKKKSNAQSCTNWKKPRLNYTFKCVRFLYVSFASLYIIISIIVLCIIIWQRILPETHFSIWVNNKGGHFHPNVNMLYYMYFFILVSFYTPRKPQEIRKPEVFCFPVVQKDSTDIKWVKWFHDLRHSHNQQYILKPLLTGTHFWLMFPFYTPWKHQKTFGFLVFSKDIKWEHCPKIP